MYGESIKEAIYDLLDKYKYSGEENLSAQVFMMPNMFGRKQAIKKKYPQGLGGFMSFIKSKIYAPEIVEH